MRLNKQEKAAAGLLVISLTLGSGILSLRSHMGKGAEAGLRLSQGVESKNARVRTEVTVKKAPPLIVHVGGRVKYPGVYSLPADSRVMDAIKAAGGGLPQSDLDALNLAALLSDGEKIEVPEQAASLTVQADGTGGDTPGRSSGNKVININSASLRELEDLPGVGPAMAGRISDYRKSKGRMTSLRDLDSISGIGPKMLEKLKPLVTFR